MTRPLDNPGACFICRRSATGFGVTVVEYAKPEHVGWLCAKCHDTNLGTRAIRMTEPTFDRYERDALIQAGNEGGEYLDGLGITDLAALPPDQYHQFLQIVVNSFGEAMRHSLKDAA